MQKLRGLNALMESTISDGGSFHCVSTRVTQPSGKKNMRQNEITQFAHFVVNNGQDGELHSHSLILHKHKLISVTKIEHKKRRNPTFHIYAQANRDENREFNLL